MTRRTLVVLLALSMVATLLGPAGAVSAQELEQTAPADTIDAPLETGDVELPPLTEEVQPSETGSYVVVMAEEPLVSTEGVEGLDSAAADRRADELVEGQDEALETTGIGTDEKVNEYTVALNGFSARISQEQAQKLATRKDVAYVVPDHMRYLQTDASPEFLRLTRRGHAWSEGLTGEGVVVGVIDSGIWPEHDSFADDGGYPEPPVSDVPCEFGNTAHNPADAPFECNNKLVGARQMLETYREFVGVDPDEFDSARDDVGHGTHTASTAAGNDHVRAEILGRKTGWASGIAHRAHIIAYKGLGNQGGFSSDLAAAIDAAVEDGVDVINYSVGSPTASLTGADDIAFLFAADAGVFVATSAGNSGEQPATIGGPASVPWLTTVGASTQARYFAGKVRLGRRVRGKIWPRRWRRNVIRGATIAPKGTKRTKLVDGEDAGDELCQPGNLDPDEVEGSIVLCLRGAVARVAKSLAVKEAGGIGMILYETDDVGNHFTDTHWVPTVHIDNTPGLAIKRYIDRNKRPKARLTGWRKTVWPWAPSMADFSSRGPNPISESIIKPDVTAPGHQILAGASPYPDPGNVSGELFQAISGTSMSSPHVAGLFAMLKQKHPDWTPAMAKSALMTTSHQRVVDNDRVTRADPFDLGAGHVRPGRVDKPSSMFNPGLVYDAGFSEYVGYLCDAAPEAVNPEFCAQLESEGVPVDAEDLNYPSIGVSQLAGVETVTRTVTSVADTRLRYRAYVDAPAGYEVKVRPRAFTLAPGASRKIRIEFHNVSAPVDEWRFGSLTWKSANPGRKGKRRWGWHRSQYRVRSPIAVQGTSIAAPEELDSEGVDGSVSFDVQFGYTGTYDAAAHGLEPATLTTDTVVQDPDQTFDPTDGFSNAHTFELSGAAHFRISIPPEATEPEADLDVFVFDPDGNLAATSTSGGTDEQVDIALPQDGTWTVFVHGWQTIGPDSDYTLYTWRVSATPGGNLEITEEPDDAVTGATGTVTAAWTGAEAGKRHLGAVSHSDGSGLMGLTLIDVDNR